MTYVDELAQAIRQQVPPELVPDSEVAALFRMYALLALTKGERVVLEDVHDAWAAWMSAQNPDHRSLKPLAQLPPEVQRSDAPYLAAIRTVVHERGLGR